MSDAFGPPGANEGMRQLLDGQPTQRIGPGGGAAPAPGGGSLNDRIAGAIESTVGGGGEQPGIIGGYWEGPSALYPDLQSHGLPDMRGPSEPYVQGDEIAKLRSMPAEARARLQDVLVATGLTSSVIPGEIDPGTVSGFEKVMAMANREGLTWSQIVSRLKSRVVRGEFGDQADGTVEPERDPFRFVDREYLPPDPAQIRNEVRDLARRVVPGVEISDDEVELLTRQFERFGQQQFAAEQDNERLQAEAQYRANRPAQPGEDEIVELSSGVAPVSAADRFREFFEERYSANIDRQESAEQEGERRNVTDANLGSLLQFATGGR